MGSIRKYPCVYMRGGTSKAVFFQKKDLPADDSEWDRLFLKVMGSPDVKQIDGMGGAMQITSKIAVIAPSDEPGIDISYTYFQVDIARAHVDRRSNCGNISSAVGPYAIDEGLVAAKEPVTVVRIRNTNTNKIIEEHVRVENGKASVFGDAQIPGVPGTGSPIDMFFEEPGGAVTGKLFPTGKRQEDIEAGDGRTFRVSIVDCSNPVVFLRAKELGLKGTELTEIATFSGLMKTLEKVRGIAAYRCGLVECPEDAVSQSTSVPKIAILSEPQDYMDIDGNPVMASDMDLCVRAVTAGMPHRSYPMTMSVCTGAAALSEGTIVHEMVNFPAGKDAEIRLGHMAGVLKVMMRMDADHVKSGGVIRTARRIMEGSVYIREGTD